jgi:hypothetical protein
LFGLWHAFGINSISPFIDGGTMTKEQLLKKISELESINDQLQTEIRYLDQLLREVGFEDGLKTLKFAAREMIEQEKNQDYKEEA